MQRRTLLAKRLELYRSAQSEIEAVAWSKQEERERGEVNNFFVKSQNLVIRMAGILLIHDQLLILFSLITMRSEKKSDQLLALLPLLRGLGNFCHHLNDAHSNYIGLTFLLRKSLLKVSYHFLYIQRYSLDNFLQLKLSQTNLITYEKLSSQIQEYRNYVLNMQTCLWSY